MAAKKIVLREVEGREKEDVKFHPLITPWTVGSKHLMMAELEIKPKGTLPRHNHGSSEVAVYFISGEGEVEIDGERFYGSSDTCFFVPAGSEVEIRNTGKEALRVLVSRAPPPKE